MPEQSDPNAHYCRVGGETVPVPSDEFCTDTLAGRPVPPNKPPGGCHCVQFVDGAALTSGLVNFHIAAEARLFRDQILKKSKRGRQFILFFQLANPFVISSLQKNPSAIGELLTAWATGTVFSKYILNPKSAAAKKAKFSSAFHASILKTISSLRKGSAEPAFHEALDFFTREFGDWLGKTPMQIAKLYSEG